MTMSVYKKTIARLLRPEVGFVLAMLCTVLVAAVLVFLVSIWCWNVLFYSGDCGDNKLGDGNLHLIVLATGGCGRFLDKTMSGYRIQDIVFSEAKTKFEESSIEHFNWRPIVPHATEKNDGTGSSA
jgi:hypothetical protein